MTFHFYRVVHIADFEMHYKTGRKPAFCIYKPKDISSSDAIFSHRALHLNFDQSN